jgi:hypothetical protein
LFQKNSLKPTVLITDRTNDVPSVEVTAARSVTDSIKEACHEIGIAYQNDLFKIADCQLYDEGLSICYYCILPFGYSNPVLKFIDIKDIDTSQFPNLQKIINLL